MHPAGVQDLLSGEAPIFMGFQQYAEENKFVGDEIARLIADGITPSEIAVFARVKSLRFHFEQELKHRGIPCDISDQYNGNGSEIGVCFSTMHGAKGLEFRYVFIVGCQSGQVPARAPVDMAADETARKAALQREKNLLYVSMTRARDRLYVTWTGQSSPFLRNVINH